MPLGSISVIPGDFHVYCADSGEPLLKPDTLDDWLLRVTDGYRAGQGKVKELLRMDAYRRNAQRVYQQSGA